MLWLDPNTTIAKKVWAASNIFCVSRGILLFFFKYCSQYCFICRASASTVSEDAGVEPRTLRLWHRQTQDALTILIFTFTEKPETKSLKWLTDKGLVSVFTLFICFVFLYTFIHYHIH